MFEWSSPYPGWVYLLLVAGIVTLIGVARRSAISDRLRRWWLFLPRFIVLVLLLGVLMNPIRRREHRLPDEPAGVPFLVDVSRSMALEQPQSRSLQVQQAIQIVDSQLQQQTDRPHIQLFRFGQQLTSAADLSQLKPIDNVTRLAAALEQLPTRFGRELPRGVVVFSDGVTDDSERLTEVASAFRAMQIPIHVYPVGSSNVRGDVSIEELVVPPRVDAGVKAAIRGVIRATGYDGERIVVQIRAADRPQLPPLATLPLTLSNQPQSFELIVEANPEYGELVLEVPVLEREVSDRNNRVSFPLTNASRKLKVIYMEGTGGTEYQWVRDALQEDKDIECVTMVADQQYVQRPKLVRVDDAYRGFPATREELLQYDCVICSDISIGAFTREQLDWTVELVDKHGGGFMMVGGITSFGAGGWDQTVWDQLIPVDMTGGMLGRGWLYHNFNVRIPEEALSHPVWRIVEDPEQNRHVLAAMPMFLGTNFMQRLKPAGTVLGVSATPIPQAGIMPIFACQAYGRGRTFAFAPDTTADWGRLFESQWGEGDNRYFRRFWRNMVRWLTENSTRGNKRLQVETDRVIYREGQPIQITAHALDEQFRKTIDYQLTARVVERNAATNSRSIRPKQGSVSEDKNVTRSVSEDVERNTAPNSQSILLVPTPQGTAYTGEMDSQSLASSSDAESSDIFASHEIEVIATQNDKEVSRASSRVIVLPDLHELIQPRAQSDVLEHLAEAAGGQTLQGTSDLLKLLRDMRPNHGNSIISRQPLWDSGWLWLLIVTLLAVEWSLRRLSGYG